MIDLNYNAAYLTFKYDNQIGTAVSNTINSRPNSPVTISKENISKNYYPNGNVSYILSITNNTDNPIKEVSVRENLGTYSIKDSTKLFTPLSYVDSSIKYYVNGILQSPPKIDVKSDHLTINIDVIPVSSVISIIYTANINDKAPIDLDSKIINISSVSTDLLEKPIETSSTISVKKNADIKIIKQINENKTNINSVTYDFMIYNYGNIEATNVTLKDTINVGNKNIKVYVDSENIKFSDYSYISGNLCVPAYSSKRVINVQPATFTQDKITGIFTINPGTIKISVEIENI